MTLAWADAASLTTGAGALTLSQQRFFTSPASAAAASAAEAARLYWVPLQVASPGLARAGRGLPAAAAAAAAASFTAATLPLSLPLDLTQDAWLKLGVNASIYGRVTYPANVWAALLGAAAASAGAAAGPLSPTDRATLFDDYLTLAESTQFSPATAPPSSALSLPAALQSLAALLRAETAYEPLTVALSHLNLLAGLLVPDIPLASAKAPLAATPFTGAPAAAACYANYTAWAARALAPALAYLTWAPIPGETPLLTQLRSSALATAAALGDAGTVAFAKGLWAASLPPTSAPLGADVEALVACTAVRYGGQAEYDEAELRYLGAAGAGDAGVARRYLSALSCARDRALLARLLDTLLDTTSSPAPIAVGDKASVVAGVAGSGYGRSLAWATLAANSGNWAQLMQWFPGGGGFDVTTLVSSLAGGFQSAEYAAAAGALWGPGGSQRASMSGAARDFVAASESVGRAMLWVAREKDALCTWAAGQA